MSHDISQNFVRLIKYFCTRLKLKLLIFYVPNKRFNIWTYASYSDRLVAELSSRHLLTPVGTVDRSYHTGGYVLQREVQRHSH